MSKILHIRTVNDYAGYISAPWIFCHQHLRMSNNFIIFAPCFPKTGKPFLKSDTCISNICTTFAANFEQSF